MKRIYYETKRSSEDDGVEVSVYNAYSERDAVRIKIILLSVWWDYDNTNERVITFLHRSDSFVIREAIRIFDEMVEAHPNI